MIHLPIFNATALPGRKEGIIGTVVIPNNFIINKYIEEDKKKKKKKKKQLLDFLNMQN